MSESGIFEALSKTEWEGVWCCDKCGATWMVITRNNNGVISVRCVSCDNENKEKL